MLDRFSLYHLKPLLALLLLFVGVRILAQTGDNCTTPIVINGLPYASSSINKLTTCGFTNDFSPGTVCQNIFTSGADVVFRFTPTEGDNCISILLDTYVGNRFSLMVLDGCPDGTGACISQAVNTDQKVKNQRSLEIKDLALTIGQTYYIIIDGTNGFGCFDFVLNIDRGKCKPIQPGSDCSNAVAIPPIPYALAPFSSCGNQDMINEGNSCALFDNNMQTGREYVLKYTPTQNECVEITSKSAASSAILASFEGCPYQESSSCIQKNLVRDGEIHQQLSLNAGVEYFFILSSDIDVDTCATFDFKITTISVTGEDCSNPYQITSLPYAGKNLLTTCERNDFISTCNSLNTDGEDVLFVYNSPGNECVSASLLNKIDSAGIALSISDDCPANPGSTCLAGVDNFNLIGNFIGVETEVTTPRTLYITVDREYVFTSPYLLFDLDVKTHTLSPQGRDCNTPLVISSVPYASPTLSTACKGKDYPVICNSGSEFYSGGNDFLARFSGPTTGCIRLTAKNIKGQGSFSLLDACPNAGASCLNQFVANAGTDSVSIEYKITAGTQYYLMANSYSNTTDLDFELKIEYIPQSSNCVSCDDNICTTCENAGFEEMSAKNWNASWGMYADPNTNNLPIDPAINNWFSRTSIQSAGSYDRIVGPELKTVSPSGGRYSMRLGDAFVTHVVGTGWSERVSYRYKVDTVNANFYYYYAVVFEDPEHDATDQPYFKVQMYDQSGIIIPCGYYEVSARGDIPGFKSTKDNFAVKWKNWTLVGVPLTNYIGQTITVEYTVKDCARGGHYGYAYIDAACTQPLSVKTETVICKGGSTELVGPTDFAKYNWNTGDSTQNITVNSSGVFTLQAINYGGCPIDFKFTVTLDDGPNMIMSHEKTCTDTKATLFAAKDSGTYISSGWDFGDGVLVPRDTVVHDFLTSGPYNPEYVVQTQNCTFRYPMPVAILDDKKLARLIDTICTGFTHQFNVNYQDTAVHLTWFDGNTNKQRVFNAAGIYPYIVRDSLCVIRDTATLRVVLPPPLSIGGDRNYCQFDSITLSANINGIIDYAWNTGDSSATIVVRDTGEYSLLADYKYCLLYDTVHIGMDTFPFYSLPGDTDLCGFKPFIVSTGVNGNTTWQDGTIGNTYTVPQPGTYWSTVRNGVCTNVDTIKVTETLQHQVSPLNDTTLCNGDTLRLNITTNAINPIVSWRDGSTQLVRSIFSSGTYYLTVFDGSCVVRDTFILTFQSPPTPQLGSDIDTCSNVSMVLNPGFFSNTHYLWNTGDTTQSILIDSAGYYQVRLIRATCTVFEDILVTTVDPPVLNMGIDTLICSRNPRVLNATLPGSTEFTWNTGATTPTLTVDHGGVYVVRVLVPPCITYDTITLTELPSPWPTMQDVPLCPDDSVLLTVASQQGIYLWNNGITAPMQYGRMTNLYTVVITNQYNCSITDSALVYPSQLCPEIYVPNAFTPDGDGINEYFYPEIYDVIIQEFYVFDRFGEVIYEAYDNNAKWDGTFQSNPVKTDVYPWKVVYRTADGNVHTKHGHVSVLK